MTVSSRDYLHVFKAITKKKNIWRYLRTKNISQWYNLLLHRNYFPGHWDNMPSDLVHFFCNCSGFFSLRYCCNLWKLVLIWREYMCVVVSFKFQTFIRFRHYACFALFMSRKICIGRYFLSCPNAFICCGPTINYLTNLGKFKTQNFCFQMHYTNNGANEYCKLMLRQSQKRRKS